MWYVCFPCKEIELRAPDHDSRRHDIRCMAVVGNRVWVGCGPFIHLLSAGDLTYEVTQGSVLGCDTVFTEMLLLAKRCIYLGEDDKKLQDIVSLSRHAVVSMSKGSTLYIYEADSVILVATFDVAPMTFIYGNHSQLL